jgi:hypothetical protein
MPLMHSTALPAEFRLAAACANWPPSERSDETIRRTAAEVVDWARFLRIVARQRIPGLAHDQLVRASIAMPEEAARALASDARALALNNLAMTAEALRLRTLLAGRRIPVVFVKGPTLAKLAYGSIGIRHSKDIDLLVPEDAIAEAAALAEREGYRRVIPAPGLGERKTAIWIRNFKHFVFLHEKKRIQLELHWRLSDNPCLMGPLPPPSSWREVPISGGLTLPTLAADDLFLYLCVHGAYHSWFRLKWLADIAALAASAPLGETERLLAVARARGIARPFAQAMLLSHQILGTPIPAGLEADRALRRSGRCLAAIARVSMTRAGAEIDPNDLAFGVTLIKLSEYFLRDWRSTLAQMRRDLVFEEDWLLLPLPDRLIFLYPVLRIPLWIWRRMKYRGRSRPPAASGSATGLNARSR